MHASIYLCMFIYVCVCVCICMYTCVYACMHNVYATIVYIRMYVYGYFISWRKLHQFEARIFFNENLPKAIARLHKQRRKLRRLS